MYCPQCGVEYRDGFTQCADCNVPLSQGAPPPEPPDPFDPALGLVVVLESNDSMQLGMAKGLLEEAGIPYYALGQITTLIQDVDPYLHKWQGLQVPRDREAEAREIMQGMLQPVGSPEDSDDDAGPTEKSDG